MNAQTPAPPRKRGEIWKAFVAGIVGAIATVVVTYFTGIFGKLVDVYLVSDASAILSHLEVTLNQGGKNGTIPGNYIADCKPPDLLIGGSCGLQSKSAAVLQNFGIDQSSQKFGCVYAGQDYASATISIYAACLHVKP